MRKIISLSLVLAFCIVAFASESLGQSPVPTGSPTVTATRTGTTTPTRTPNITLVKGAKRLTADRLEAVTKYSPGGEILGELLANGARVIAANGANNARLGRSDIGTVIAVLAFTTSTGAPASKTLLTRGVDYQTAEGDLGAIGDHTAETWVVIYRP